MAGKRKKKRRNLFAGISAGALMLAAAGLLLLSYLSVVVNPAKVWFFSVFGLLFFPLFVLNLVLLVWAAARRSRLFLIPLLAVLPSLFFVGRYVRFGGSSDAERVAVRGADGEETLTPAESEALGAGGGETAAGLGRSGAAFRLLTYNVGRFSHRRDEMSPLMCMDSVFAYLGRQDADVICLQEYMTEDLPGLKRYVRSHLPGYDVEYYLFKGRRRSCGNVTLSRLTPCGKGKILFEDSRNLAIYTDYATSAGKFRVYNCHFESYAISISNLWKSVTGDRELLQANEKKFRKSLIRRPKQVSEVLAHIERSPVESVVCGDFNDNPMSYTYFRIGRDLKDSFVESGRGFGASYSAFWPMLRIDYVFIPKNWSSTSHRTDRVKFSDHYPVVTEVVPGR